MNKKKKQIGPPPFDTQATVTIFNKIFMVTDLSQNISMDNPTFPGHLRTVIWDHLTMEETIKLGYTKKPYCYRVKGFMMCDHTSTHVDAINHIVARPDARAVDKLPLTWSMAPGVWFDFSESSKNSYITVQDVKKAIKITKVKLPRNGVVLYYTGWSKKWQNPYEYIKDYPGMDRSAMEYLADRGIICVGADAPSIDSYAEVKTVRIQPAHIVCREREILNIENLGRVDRIPKHEFFFIGLPLKIKESSGSPIRAVAITEK